MHETSRNEQQIKGQSKSYPSTPSQPSVSAFLTAPRLQRTPRPSQVGKNKMAPEASSLVEEESSHRWALDEAIPVDIRELLRALPTKDDIRTMLVNLEETHRRETQETRGEIVAVQARVETLETSAAVDDTRIVALEIHQVRQDLQWVSLQLHLEDLEDWGRRNNLRLRGVPEAEEDEDVTAVLQAVFQTLTASGAMVLLDRAHCTLGQKRLIVAGPWTFCADCIIIQRKRI